MPTISGKQPPTRTDADGVIVPTREGYERWADSYDSDGNPLIALEERHFPRMLPDVRGLLVADIGCGTGRQTRKLAERGARVVAMDFSRAMLERAQMHVASAQVQWVITDILTSIPLNNGVLEGAVCSLVLEHVQDIGPVMRELRRVCRPNAFVLITDIHPALASGGIAANFRDRKTGRKIFPRGHRHEISDYLSAADEAGFRIADMMEGVVERELAQTTPRAAKYLGARMLLLLSLVAA
jgi:ubiquinone/menaquinone biosynthesis C-methylase UbiE